MKRIDTPTAAPGGLWTDGNALTGATLPTQGTPGWFNGVQEAIVGAADAADMSPADRRDQLQDAIAALAKGHDRWYVFRRLSANATIAAGPGTVNLSWGAGDVHLPPGLVVGDFWAASPNPERITIPAGVRRVRLRAFARMFSYDPDFSVAILKNGAAFIAGADWFHYNAGELSDVLVTPIIDVEPGDYFTVQAEITGSAGSAPDGGTIYGSAAPRAWCELEIVEWSPLLLSDDATGTNGTLITAHAPGVGGAWSYLTGGSFTGDITIQSNKFNAAANVKRGAVVDVAKRARVLRASIVTGGSTSTYQAGLLFRVVDSLNFWRVAKQKGSDLRWFIIKTTAGSESTAASFVDAATGTQSLELRDDGARMAVYVDGLKIMDHADDAFSTATKCGIWMSRGASGSAIDIDTVRAWG